jgi:hypothetical protein
MKNNKTVNEVLALVLKMYQDNMYQENSTITNKLNNLIKNLDLNNDKTSIINTIKLIDAQLNTNFDTFEGGPLYVTSSQYSYDTDRVDFQMVNFAFKFNDEVKSIYEILGITPEEAFEIYKNEDKKFTTSIYSYFILTKRFDLAQKMITDVVAKYNPSDIVCMSQLSNYYVPVFRYIIDNNYKMDTKKLLTSYLKAIELQPEEVHNDFDAGTFKRVVIKFKKDMLKINKSQFLSLDNGVKSKDDVNLFDLIESDFSFRESVFRVFNSKSARVLKTLVSQNPEKTKQLLIEYLNVEHIKGRRKNQFMSTYGRIKRVLDSENSSIDIFKLDEKLQSYLLLDFMG